jgi:hypothetical protein
MNDDEIYKPAFVIHGKIPKPKPPEPIPVPRKPPSDEVLSSNNERCWQWSAARPVILNGQETGEWQVSLVNPKKAWVRKWIVKPNEDDAYDWCRKVERLRSRKV